MTTVFILGDTHFPFISYRALDKALTAIKTVKPDVVLQIGDLADMYSWSKFPRTHGIFTPHQELIRARKGAERMWHDIKKLAPKARLLQLTGNHDVRPHKRALELIPEIEPMLGLKSIFEFPGVETLHDELGIIIDGVYYQHGFRKFGEHVKHNRMNTVCGHLHLGGIHFMRLGKNVLFELNVGHLANPYSAPMSYGKQRQFATWTHGYGVVRDQIPTFYPVHEK